MKRLLLLTFFVLIVSTAAYEECREKKTACTNRPTMPQDGSKQSCGGKSGGGGGGGNGTPRPTSTPDPRPVWQGLLGKYSHSESGAAACDSAHPNIVDPITVVARLHWHPFLPDWPGTDEEERHWESASDHLRHHHFTHGASRGQYFKEGLSCEEGEISLAEYGCPGDCDGYHARGLQQTSVQDPFHPRRAGESFGATVTAMTPHYDELVFDVDCGVFDLPPLAGHVVEEDYNPNPDIMFSGFDAGREHLATHWVVDSNHHQMVASEFWDNTEPILQCNGSDNPRSNGYVYHIGLCQVSYPC